MPKRYLEKDVLTAARERVAFAFDNFDKICVSYSGGKDSTVMLHLTMDEALKRDQKISVLFIDLEGQYKLTIDHITECLSKYEDHIELYWVCLPILLRNAVSVYQPRWLCWDKDCKDAWVRDAPDKGIFDESYFPFFEEGMEFEEFVPEFSEWLADGKSLAQLVGIRANESLNRFRTIASVSKIRYDNMQFTTKVSDNVFNVYPIYDWRTEDVWTYHGKNPDKCYNELYNRMHLAGLSIHLQRICQPYGDDQRRGLWLFHLIEPETWARIVARVNGANGGAQYIQEWGNINGYRKITKPPACDTWKSFAKLLAESMPPSMKEHYLNKIFLFEKWWSKKGYPEGIPDEAPYDLEAKRKVPSWRRVCKSLLRNDYWCKGIGFSQQKSSAYLKYLERTKKQRLDCGFSLER
jgi:predicted phosphoadenosine phosphosulfate sulfurtransferase